MHHPTDRIAHTTAFVTPVVEHWLEREEAQWVHHEGSIQRPIMWIRSWRKEMFYLMTHSEHFIYSYMWTYGKERGRNVLFNEMLSSFNLWLYNVWHIVMVYMGYSFRLAARYLLYALSLRQEKSKLLYYPISTIFRSWCDGSSDRSFMIGRMSYFSFQPGITKAMVCRIMFVGWWWCI